MRYAHWYTLKKFVIKIIDETHREITLKELLESEEKISSALKSETIHSKTPTKDNK